MNFNRLVSETQSALLSAGTQAKINYNENALAQVALGYALLALAESFYRLATVKTEVHAVASPSGEQR